jgi:integrase
MAKAPPRKFKLTDAFIRSLPPAPPGKRTMNWDTEQSNFAVRVTDRGGKSFVVMKRPEGGKMTLTVLGQYPTMTLREARQEAQRVLRMFARGDTPKRALAREIAAERARKQHLFDNLVEDFVKAYLPQLRSAERLEANLRKKLLGRWTGRACPDITQRDVRRMVEQVAEEDGPSAARAALSAASGIFGWALIHETHGVEANPAQGLRPSKLLGREPARDRILSDPELAGVWRASERLGYPIEQWIKLLILTGQRRTEVAGLSWGEVDREGALLNIPASRMKGNLPHVVPLSSSAKTIIDELPRQAGDYLFSVDNGFSPFNGFLRSKEKLDRLLPDDTEHWTYHDIRRTVRSNLGKLGVNLVVAELVLSHRQRGIVGRYDRHEYLDEKRDALERWSKRLNEIVP